jgi:hypothetical protein
VLANYAEIFVNWRSGHSDLALPHAIEVAEKIVFEHFIFGYVNVFLTLIDSRFSILDSSILDSRSSYILILF